jgi:hypothetical protein
MNRTLLGLAALVLPTFGANLRAASAAGGPPLPPPPAPVYPTPAPGAPAPAPSSSEEQMGLRCLDEASRWIAKGEAPPDRLLTLHADIDYVYDDGSNHDERRMELWFRNPDAFLAKTQYQGRDTSLLLTGEQGYMIRDRIRVTDLNASPTMKELLPMMRNYRAILREVGRLMAPAGLKGPGARFRFLGQVQDPRATGGMWYKVVRQAPGEGDMTFFFGSAPRKDGQGIRAIAPDRLILAGDPGTNYAGDEYRMEEWAHEGPAARNEAIRYPKRIRMYALNIDPENKPTMRAVINFAEVNVAIDPQLFKPY